MVFGRFLHTSGTFGSLSALICALSVAAVIGAFSVGEASVLRGKVVGKALIQLFSTLDLLVRFFGCLRRFLGTFCPVLALLAHFLL